MEIYIRPIRTEDAEEVNTIRRFHEVMNNTMALPSETVAISHKFTDSVDCKNSHQFVAVSKENGVEKVIGIAGLHIQTSMRARHCGGIGITVHPNYQNKGVGTMLLAEIINLADNFIALKRLELEVYPDNEAAIHLYKKFGFETEGCRRAAIVRCGKYADIEIMGRLRD